MNNKEIINQKDNTTLDINFAGLLPNLPNIFSQEPISFIPSSPLKRFPLPPLKQKLLTKKIYIEMLRSIKDYASLEKIISDKDKNTISSLKSQMEILSIALLNIYQPKYKSSVPFFQSPRIPLSRLYTKAIIQMYDRVYFIHELTEKLYRALQEEQYKKTLIIIFLNLKSQLKILNNFIKKTDS